MMPTEEFLDEEPPPSSKGKRSTKKSADEDHSFCSKKRSSKKRSAKASHEDDRSASIASSKDKKTKKKSKESKLTRSSKSHKKSSSKDRRSKSSSQETNEEDVKVAPTLAGLTPFDRDSCDFDVSSRDFTASGDLSGDFDVKKALAGLTPVDRDSCDFDVNSRDFTASSAFTSSGDFAVQKGSDVEKRWGNFAHAHKTAQTDLSDSYGSNEFDAVSITSGLTTAIQPQTSRGFTQRESVSSPGSFPVASRPGAFSVASRPGANYVSNRTGSIQEILDRKFSATEESKGGEVEAMPAVASAQVGAHYVSALPDRIQNMLDRKFNQLELGIETRAEQGTIQDLLNEKLKSFQPSYIASSTTERLSSIERDIKKIAGVDNDIVAEDPCEVEPTASMQFSAWNYGKGNERDSIAAPPPDILTNHLIDDQDFALSGIERKEKRLAAGLCVDCGRTQTHEKIRYGPFKAFRRMKPLTTPGQVYKGYCLFCNNIVDLRRYLQEPYLRKQDVDGTLRDELFEEEPTNRPSSDESVTKTKRIHICLCIGVLAMIAGVIGIGLVIALANTTNATPSTGSEQSSPPTAAPGPPGWHQVGSDISEVVTSFGYKVAISTAGNRVAVSSPKALQSTGRADIFEFVDESNKWLPMGSSILGNFAGDLAGYDIDLSDEGNDVIIGYPGNGAGFVRVFHYGENQWQQVGGTLLGETSGGRFGASVAINPDGSFICVGAPNDTNENGSEAGRVRVFQLKDNQWTQVGSDLLGRAALDHFGMSVTISESGEVLAVGAPNNDERWQDGGQVHIFRLGLGTEGNLTWTEPLVEQSKILGDSEAHQYGTVVRMNGHGDTIVSSAINAENYEGTDGGGDPRVMYIDFTDGTAEEIGYGFSAIPGTIGLGYSIDVDLDGTKVIASTLNYEGRAGKAMTYDIAGNADWVAYPSGVEFGGEKLGQDVWLGQGPSVAISSTGSHFAIGYESIVVDSLSLGARPVVRVYFYG